MYDNMPDWDQLAVEDGFAVVSGPRLADQVVLRITDSLAGSDVEVGEIQGTQVWKVRLGEVQKVGAGAFPAKCGRIGACGEDQFVVQLPPDAAVPSYRQDVSLHTAATGENTSRLFVHCSIICVDMSRQIVYATAR